MFPKTGTTVLKNRNYASTIASALRRELGAGARATKTVSRWTGASERSATYWLSGQRGPDGRNLILLARHSDTVLQSILRMAQRDSYELSIELDAARAALVRAVALIDALVPPKSGH